MSSIRSIHKTRVFLGGTVLALGLTLGAVNDAAAFAQPFALAALVALLGMIAALVLLPAKSLQRSTQA